MLRKPSRRMKRLTALALIGGVCLLITRSGRRAPSSGTAARPPGQLDDLGHPMRSPDTSTHPGFSRRARILLGAFNRVALTFAGRRFSPYAVVYHVGRRSGRMYTTPVVVGQVGTRFVIPLPYGATVDWVRNLQAREQGALKWQGQIYEVGALQVVGPEEGRPALPQIGQWVSRRLGFTQFLRLQELDGT